MKANHVTKAKIRKDIKSAFENDRAILPAIARRTEPDCHPLHPNTEDFIHMVDYGHYADEKGYYILYNAYWHTTSITSALMCSPDVLGQSYLPEAQLKRMAEFIYGHYVTLMSLNGTIKHTTA
jgi:hypothetical protein